MSTNLRVGTRWTAARRPDMEALDRRPERGRPRVPTCGTGGTAGEDKQVRKEEKRHVLDAPGAP